MPLLDRVLIAAHTVNSARVDAVEEIRKITDGGVEYALERTGIPKVSRQAIGAQRA